MHPLIHELPQETACKVVNVVVVVVLTVVSVSVGFKDPSIQIIYNII